MKLPLQTLQNPELVIGLVGRIGTDLHKVVGQIQLELSMLNYECIEIHLTDYIHQIPGLPAVDETPTERRYRTYIAACNAMREETERKDFMAFLGISAIKHHRKQKTGDFKKPRPRTAYILNQLKRPEEIHLLKQVYGPIFVPISCHAHKVTRLRYITGKITADHPEKPKHEEWELTASELISQDDSEEVKPYGQRVRDAFPLSDLIINTSNEALSQSGLNRFFRALFGDHRVSPTREEYGANLAVIASLRAVDPSRQVGAAIIRATGEVISLGCNEVPKYGGGTYWTGDALDARDFQIGHDENTRRKRNMVLEILSLLREKKYFETERVSEGTDLAREFLDKEGALLKDCLIMDTLEFGRGLHAEMCALSDAARNGVTTKNAALYTTTFPCHNCAKHIVGAGITRVLYQKPYPKSAVAELSPASVEIDPDYTPNHKVIFEQFIGITSNKYSIMFEKERLKNEAGLFQEWRPREAHPVTNRIIPSYLDIESGVIADLVDTLPEKYRAALAGPVPRAAE